MTEARLTTLVAHFADPEADYLVAQDPAARPRLSSATTTTWRASPNGRRPRTRTTTGPIDMSAAADFDRTRRIQREASDPASSAWVVANAGSGKTHVLTQRVIRLLLAGTDPGRDPLPDLHQGRRGGDGAPRLRHARRMDDAADAELARGDRGAAGRSRRRATRCASARRLFARALETPGGLKIQTIHAFCERLLHQFPFEANVPGPVRDARRQRRRAR